MPIRTGTVACSALLVAALGSAAPLPARASTSPEADGGSTPSIGLLGEQVIDGHWVYVDDATGQLAHGFMQLDGKTVYYDDTGAMVYGLQDIPGHGLRYFDPITGALACDRWVTAQGSTYRAGADGAFLTGEQSIDGKWYWLDPAANGARAVGFADIPDGRPGHTTKTVHYGEDGAMSYGELCIDGRWYHFDEVFGEMTRGLCDLPAGKTVYYGEDGAMRYGAQEVPGLGLRSFDRITGAMVKDGWGEAPDGSRAYFDAAGADTGYRCVTDELGASYLVDADGTRLTGFQTVGGSLFHADPATGALSSGWIEEGGSTYYADPTTHELVRGEAVVEGAWRLFAEDGSMRTGFVELAQDGGTKTVYYGADGAMRYGEQLIDGSWYYLDTVTGAMRTGWKYLDAGDKWAWYGSDGRMRYGDQVVDDGRTIHFDEHTGAAAIPVTERQRRVAAQAELGDTYGLDGGWCQAWVCRTYGRAGESADSRACAYEAMRAWRVSTGRGGIPVGATVYSTSRSGSHGWSGGIYYEDFGHVGIYIGGGRVASLMYGSVMIEPVEVWTDSAGYFGWGWNGGVAL